MTNETKTNESKIKIRIEALASDYASDLCGNLQASQKEAYTLAYLELLDFAEEIATVFADEIATILVQFSETSLRALLQALQP